MSMVINLTREAEDGLRDRAVPGILTPERLAALMLNDLLSYSSSFYLEELIEQIRLTPERIAERQQQTIQTYNLDMTQPGKEHWSSTIGKWPGDETDEQIAAALAEIS